MSDSDKPKPGDPKAAEAPATPGPQDPGADITAQLLEILRHTERSILLVESLPKLNQRRHDQLLGLRDRLEESFEVELAARLRAGSIGFEADVAELRKVMKNLEEATRRAARAQEILSYVAMAVDLVSNVVAKLAPFF